MRRRGDELGRPPIPNWVADSRCYDGVPDAPLPVRFRTWGRNRWQWIDDHGYDVFDLNDRQVELRRLVG